MSWNAAVASWPSIGLAGSTLSGYEPMSKLSLVFDILSFMVLSEKDIREFLATGDIVIKPFTENGLKPASYTLSLGTVLLRPLQCDLVKPDDPFVEYEQITMGPGGYTVRSGEFLLGQVAEELSVSGNICCFLDARTSLARLGLNVLQGSTLVEPGQKGSFETLEIINIGPSPIHIYPGLNVVKAVFQTLRTATRSGYRGKYAGQKDARAK